ncbi:MAG: type II toxin-antitoxin system HigB family toxin [Candidatus Competibacteraceae bacterium]|jgi:mRNA interferase HigB|nr:MAG: type II toxin-antitoxin system HigB family toxin [Candidatus Competibacteraceae bacterium]
MHTLSRKKLRDFWQRHPDAEIPLASWYRLMERGIYRNFAELRMTFPGVDKVGDLYVFNIGGNKYRLIAAIEFEWQKVFVKNVLTHQEYDRGDWK